MAKPDLTRAFAPPDFSGERGRAAIHAIQALATGKASEAQQETALDFIIHDICRTYDCSFRPDDKGGERDTSFAEGRRFAGLQIERVIRNSYDKLVLK